MADQESGSLKLLVQDADDLAVVSAHLQDTVVRIGDMAFLPKEQRFALVGCRFDWVAAEKGRTERCHTGLHFDHVLHAAFQGFDPKKTDTVLNLLSAIFIETDVPSGEVLLTFSGGAAVRLEVECLDAQMRDFGARWTAAHCPDHVQAAEA